MPSKWSGANPGKSVVERFQLVWPSFALHMLVHSLVWSDVLTWERKHGQLNHIVKMRADAGWLGDARAPRDLAEPRTGSKLEHGR